MTNIFHFVPGARATTQANLEAFIETANLLLKGYPGVHSWDEPSWDLVGVAEMSGTGNTRSSVTFTSYDGVEQGTGEEMSEPFRGFAKGYFLYQQALTPTTSLQPAQCTM
jgi:hypothetical protein